ncbi:MAG: hypothetical protein RI894_243, partial [Bacteroidota bacterium]
YQKRRQRTYRSQGSETIELHVTDK